jgi:peptidoglycan/LPS O-acetylase OafA/YrhL
VNLCTRNNFDLLRLLAAWSVLFSHGYALAGIPGKEPFLHLTKIDTLGGLGVSIFFVLSGFLVTESWLRTPNLLQFAAKRVRRIYPGLLVCVFVTVVLFGAMSTTLPLREYFASDTTRAYLLTASAWDIRFVLPGVFASTPLPNAVNGSLWSLRYEVLCYLVLSAIAILPIASKLKSTIALLLLAGLVIARPKFNMWDFGGDHFGVGSHATKVCFLFACGAFMSTWRESMQLSATTTSLALIGVSIAIGLKAYGLRYELLYLSCLAVAVLGVALNFSWVPKLPIGMGDWSYGIYLYAFPIQQLLAEFAIYANYGFVVYTLSSTMAATAFAAASWYFVERRWLRRK